MFALLITAAAASLTPTLDLAPRSIDIDGVRATYTRTVDADGTVHLKGVYKGAKREHFQYTVRGDRVDGKIDGIPVAFEVPRNR